MILSKTSGFTSLHSSLNPRSEATLMIALEINCFSFWDEFILDIKLSISSFYWLIYSLTYSFSYFNFSRSIYSKIWSFSQAKRESRSSIFCFLCEFWGSSLKIYSTLRYTVSYFLFRSSIYAWCFSLISSKFFSASSLSYMASSSLV